MVYLGAGKSQGQQTPRLGSPLAGRLYEALEQVQKWHRASTSSGAHCSRVGSVSLAETILHGSLVEGLCEVAEIIPLDLGFKLGELVEPGCSVPAELGAKLEQRLWLFLQSEDRSGLSLALGIQVAKDETLVECTRGGKLWLELVMFVVSKLERLGDVELFTRCRPHPDFRAAVAQEVGGWISLELQMRASM